MPHVTFVYPCVGRFPDTRYVRSWQMQPLSIAVLSALTPADWQKTFYDDRLEPIDFAQPTDLAAISIETFTARRGYQIADEYRKRGVPVVMGGYHATFCPEEVLEHADAVCTGEAEGVWPRILHDAAAGRLSGVYAGPWSPDLAGVRTDRDIFAGKDYFKIAMVETGRGCRFRCNFCSISAFYQATCRRRPVPEIIAEIKRLKEKTVFFVDDNMVGDLPSARELLRALKPLGIHWLGQASINAAADPELADLIAASGCRGLLVGFESLDRDNLSAMGKAVNQAADYERALAVFRKRRILIYGTFMFGFPHDSAALVRDTVGFARGQKLFLAAFAHTIPFPGTPLYESLRAEGRLLHDRWWLSEEYRFGQAPYHPACMSAAELEQMCHRARRRFYSLPSIVQRGLDLSANCSGPRTATLFFGLNLLLRREISQKRGLPLGVRAPPAHPAVRRVTAEVAVAADDAALRDLMRRTPMPGAVRLAYLREPGFFEAARVEGRYSETVVGRDATTGRVMGLGSRSVKTAFINGLPSPLGYLSSLRMLEEYRGGSYLPRGYRLFRERHRDGRTRLYLTTIVESNAVAKGILTSGRAGLPAYHDFGRFCCMAVGLRQTVRAGGWKTLEVRPAGPPDMPAVIGFLKEEGARRQFFPEYVAGDLLPTGLLRGLRPEDILLAFTRGELVGTVAAWDQTPFRQTLVAGYSRALGLLRPLYNATAALLGYPALPPPGSHLDCFNLALVCVRNDDPAVFARLLDGLLERCRPRYRLLLAGLHERDPLLPVLRRYRHFAYTSRLYVVCWEDGEADFKSLDDRVPYLELGAL